MENSHVLPESHASLVGFPILSCQHDYCKFSYEYDFAENPATAFPVCRYAPIDPSHFIAWCESGPPSDFSQPAPSPFDQPYVPINQGSLPSCDPSPFFSITGSPPTEFSPSQLDPFRRSDAPPPPEFYSPASGHYGPDYQDGFFPQESLSPFFEPYVPFSNPITLGSTIPSPQFDHPTPVDQTPEYQNGLLPQYSPPSPPFYNPTPVDQTPEYQNGILPRYSPPSPQFDHSTAVDQTPEYQNDLLPPRDSPPSLFDPDFNFENPRTFAALTPHSPTSLSVTTSNDTEDPPPCFSSTDHHAATASTQPTTPHLEDTYRPTLLPPGLPPPPLCTHPLCPLHLVHPSGHPGGLYLYKNRRRGDWDPVWGHSVPPLHLKAMLNRLCEGCGTARDVEKIRLFDELHGRKFEDGML